MIECAKLLLQSNEGLSSFNCRKIFSSLEVQKFVSFFSENLFTNSPFRSFSVKRPFSVRTTVSVSFVDVFWIFSLKTLPLNDTKFVTTFVLGNEIKPNWDEAIKIELKGPIAILVIDLIDSDVSIGFMKEGAESFSPSSINKRPSETQIFPSSSLTTSWMKVPLIPSVGI